AGGPRARGCRTRSLHREAVGRPEEVVSRRQGHLAGDDDHGSGSQTAHPDADQEGRRREGRARTGRAAHPLGRRPPVQGDRALSKPVLPQVDVGVAHRGVVSPGDGRAARSNRSSYAAGESVVSRYSPEDARHSREARSSLGEGGRTSGAGTTLAGDGRASWRRGWSPGDRQSTQRPGTPYEVSGSVVGVVSP